MVRCLVSSSTSTVNLTKGHLGEGASNGQIAFMRLRQLNSDSPLIPDSRGSTVPQLQSMEKLRKLLRFGGSKFS
jgi:hypothetical protein